jgi:hypothetical protein
VHTTRCLVGDEDAITIHRLVEHIRFIHARVKEINNRVFHGD